MAALSGLIVVLLLAILFERRGEAQVTASGFSTIYSSPAYESGHLVKTGPCTMVSLVGYNSGPTQFIQVHNTSTAPAPGAVPTYFFVVPTANNFSLDIPISGAPLSNGLSVNCSSTGPTLTPGSNNVFYTVVTR